jgi:hypothetical protein
MAPDHEEGCSLPGLGEFHSSIRDMLQISGLGQPLDHACNGGWLDVQRIGNIRIRGGLSRLAKGIDHLQIVFYGT